MFTEKELHFFESKGISQERAKWQIQQFESGVDPINLIKPAIPGNGILLLDNKDKYIELYKSAEVKITKFVPASGAASRMFKALFEFNELNSDNSENKELPEPIDQFFKDIKKFAFYNDLNKALEEQGGIENLIYKKKYLQIIDKLLASDGLAYGELPKGLLKFHFYAGNVGRTPFEEHLVEGAKYAKSSDGIVNLHFTVSPEHKELFKVLESKILDKYEDMYSVKYNISFSVQKSSTDTLAVTSDNKPFYNEDGTVFFRPGGHGALIENLNEIDSDIIYIKNIDNVIPEKRLETTIKVKQSLAGLLLQNQKKIFTLIHKLTEAPSTEVIDEAKQYLNETLCLGGSCTEFAGDDQSIIDNIIARLNRPLRVCGMVKNEGEPGGGPFLIKDKSGCVSPQIIESSQIDLDDKEQSEIFQKSTHFNPVDLVCGVKDFKGNKFNLKDFIDESTCFISTKSKNGKELKALELPGLWNGAMADWNTIFVEVPANTFNPVKIVNDLLREAHQ